MSPESEYQSPGKPWPLGLVGAGPVSKSFIAGLPHLSQRLGPVAAQSYRLASRLVNSIRAGYPVKNFEQLEQARVILLCVPEALLPETIGALSRARIHWNRKVLLLCESIFDNRLLAEIRRHGASAGALQPIEALPDRYLVRGDPKAVAEAKRLVQDLNAKPFEIKFGKGDAYAAGLTFATSLFTPLIDASVECLRIACGNRADAERISEALLRRSIRAYIHAGKRSWGGPLAKGDWEAIARELKCLLEHDPNLGRYYRDSGALALERFKRDPDLVRIAAAPTRQRPAHPRAD